MKPVFYLCNYEDGLVFAKELPDDYFTLGTFFFEGNDDGYLFEAMDKGKEISLTLQKKNNNKYKYFAETPYGICEFTAEDVNLNYVGKNESLFNHKLNILIPNEIQLEQLCRDEDFYFIGSSG